MNVNGDQSSNSRGSNLPSFLKFKMKPTPSSTKHGDLESKPSAVEFKLFGRDSEKIIDLSKGMDKNGS